MKDLPIHLILFLFTSLVIVALGAMFAERSDEKALKALPRRFGVFVFGCSALAVVMLICEHLFAT